MAMSNNQMVYVLPCNLFIHARLVDALRAKRRREQGEEFSACHKPLLGMFCGMGQLVGLRKKLQGNPIYHGKIMENLWFPVKIFP